MGSGITPVLCEWIVAILEVDTVEMDAATLDVVGKTAIKECLNNLISHFIYTRMRR